MRENVPQKWVSSIIDYMIITENLFAEVANSSEFLKTLESCTEPGQPGKTFVSTMLLSQTICQGNAILNLFYVFYIVMQFF